MDPTQSTPATQSTPGAGTSTSGDTPLRRKVRGKTRCLKLYKLPPGTKKNVKIDDRGQPVEENTTVLANFCGNLARDGCILRIDVPSWKDISRDAKQRAWALIQDKFEIPPSMERTIMKSLCKKWKDNKSRLGTKHFVFEDPPAVNYARCPPDVIEAQWHVLVDFWYSDEGQKWRVRNKANRASQQLGHKAGTKSFVRLREEERFASPSGIAPGRADMFIKTHTHKTGLPVNTQAGEQMRRMQELLDQVPAGSQDSTGRDDIFSQVMGPEHPGRFRGCGLGPTPTQLWGSSASIAFSSSAAQDARMAVMERELAENRARMEQMETRSQTEIQSLRDLVQQLLDGRAPVAPAASVQEGVGSTHLSDLEASQRGPL